VDAWSYIPQSVGAGWIKIDAVRVWWVRRTAQLLLGADIKRIAAPPAVLTPGTQALRIDAFRSMKCS
jgi:hypothetical protein